MKTRRKNIRIICRWPEILGTKSLIFYFKSRSTYDKYLDVCCLWVKCNSNRDISGITSGLGIFKETRDNPDEIDRDGRALWVSEGVSDTTLQS